MPTSFVSRMVFYLTAALVVVALAGMGAALGHYRTLARASAMELSALRAMQAARSPRAAAPATEATPAAGPNHCDELWLRVFDLEQQLDEARRQTPDTVIVTQAAAAAAAPAPGPSDGRREDWMDRMRREEPERYAAMMAEREAARRDVHKAFAEKAAFLLDRETSDLPEEEQARYQAMLDLLDTAWTLSERLRADLPREERRPLMRNLRDTMRALQPLLNTERDRELVALGLDVGLDETEAQQFTDYVNNLMNLTSTRVIFDRFRRGYRPPPPATVAP